MTVYLSSAYLAPVEYYTKLLAYDQIYIEQHDHYTAALLDRNGLVYPCKIRFFQVYGKPRRAPEQHERKRAETDKHRSDYIKAQHCRCSHTAEDYKRSGEHDVHALLCAKHRARLYGQRLQQPETSSLK